MERHTSTIFDKQKKGMRDIFGPLVDFSPHGEGDYDYAVICGIVPLHTTVPLHSHPDCETILVLEGKLSAWLDGSWRTYEPGELINIYPHARHALRNDGADEVSLVLVTTARMAKFLEEISAPPGEADLSPERIDHFAKLAADYGYWSGGREDQMAIGVVLPFG